MLNITICPVRSQFDKFILFTAYFVKSSVPCLFALKLFINYKFKQSIKRFISTSTSVLGRLHFTEDVTHDLAAHRLRQGVHELDAPRVLVRRRPPPHKVLQLCDQLVPVSLLLHVAEVRHGIRVKSREERGHEERQLEREETCFSSRRLCLFSFLLFPTLYGNIFFPRLIWRASRLKSEGHQVFGVFTGAFSENLGCAG